MLRFLKPFHRQSRPADPFYAPPIDLKKPRMNRKKHLDWVEESFDASADQQYGGHLVRKSQYLGLILTQAKLMGVFFFILLGLTLLLVRIFYLQVVQGD